MAKKVIIIGSGFAGLSASCFLAKAGYDVTVIEKNNTPGGRARQLKKEGFIFDIGPSWYWMPDVFENFFNHFGKKVEEYYNLVRLDPSYKIYWQKDSTELPANYNELKKIFKKLEPKSGKQLDKFLTEAKYKYNIGINKLVHKPGQSVTEFFDTEFLSGLIRLDVFCNMKKHISKYFKNKKTQQILEFPVLFLGALAKDIPALYSLMNYADIKLGTWYPQGGMYKIVTAMYNLATELGVIFNFNCDVTKIIINKSVAKSITVQNNNKATILNFNADIIIASADYHFVETKLLEKKYCSYNDVYWNKKIMAPSCIIFFVGINKKIKNLFHHSLFFDTDFEQHGIEIYTNPQWPTNPLFYVCAPSVTDNTVAPEGHENLFFLIPIAAGLQGDTEALREKYFDNIITRFENKIEQQIKQNIVYKKSYSVSNFITDYNAFKGNAYGLANTLKQTAIFKPSCKSKKVKNLFYSGQLTVPGPGVPPSIISGKVVATEVIKFLKN